MKSPCAQSYFLDQVTMIGNFQSIFTIYYVKSVSMEFFFLDRGERGLGRHSRARARTHRRVHACPPPGNQK